MRRARSESYEALLKDALTVKAGDIVVEAREARTVLKKRIRVKDGRKRHKRFSFPHG